MVPIPEVNNVTFSNMSAFEDNLEGEFYVLDSYSVDDLEEKDSTTTIPIQWKEGGIKCPVPKCNVTFCTTKESFTRHWEETHRQWFNYQVCPECGTELRRFIELQQHMRQEHDFKDNDFSTVLPSVKVTRKVNVNYIDPGPYRPPDFPKTFNNQNSRYKLVKNNTTNNGSNLKKPKDLRSQIKSHNPLLTKRKPPFTTAVIKPKIQKENEDSKCDGQSTTLPTWTMPDVPSDRQLLVDYLKWADSIICQVGNSRLEAKNRLEALDNDSELHKERELRKKLEKELETSKAELETSKAELETSKAELETSKAELEALRQPNDCSSIGDSS